MPLDRVAVDHLRSIADALASGWAERARTRTTLGRERATLALFGVDGLDRLGRPLAPEVVERFVGDSVERLARGVALPFAMAAVEYDLEPRELALDVASGAVDLALEAELLADPERRAAAIRHAEALVAGATARIDANRTARRELLDVLGDRPRPWVAMEIEAAEVAAARDEAIARIRGGADVLRVTVPAGRELNDRLATRAGEDALRKRVVRTEGPVEVAPAGSQRGLGALREVVDVAAAEQGRYVRLGTRAPALGAPEQAVVGAFGRLDLLCVDPVSEIVEALVDPDRVLADNAVAAALHRRSGAELVVGGAPLVVGPDLLRGLPSDAATRAGRGLALQAVAVALLRSHGIPDEQIAIDALPEWLADEPDAFAVAVSQVLLRRAVHPGLRLSFAEPTGTTSVVDAWPFILAGVLPLAGPTSHVLRRTRAASHALGTIERASSLTASRTKAAIGTAAGWPGTLDVAPGPHALDLAAASLRAAIETLEAMARHGWSAVTGTPGPDARASGRRAGGGPGIPAASDAVVERVEAFDPFALEAAEAVTLG